MNAGEFARRSAREAAKLGPYGEAKRLRVLARLAVDPHEASHYRHLAFLAERAEPS
jgi:hypothetical protein